MLIGESELMYCGEYKMTENDSSLIVGDVSKKINISTGLKSNEIRVDLQVKTLKSVKVWGQIIKEDNEPVNNALVKIVKELKDDKGRKEYLGVADSITDCGGFYQFCICIDDANIPSTFKVFVGMQALDHEIHVKKIINHSSYSESKNSYTKDVIV